MTINPETIEVAAAPPQNDTYSQAVRMGELVYLSGQLGVKSDMLLPQDFRDEVRHAIENVRTVLEAAGSSLPRVGKVNIYVTNFQLLAEMNEVYRDYFRHRPAKTTVEVSRLDKGARIEIEVVAACG